MWKDELAEKVEHLKQLRDELRVQMHLAKADARDEFDELEKKWEGVQSQLKDVGAASSEAMEGVAEAGKLLLEEIGEGYKRIRKAL